MKHFKQVVLSLWRNTTGALRRADCGDLQYSRSILFVDCSFNLKLRIFLRDLRHIMEGSKSSLHPSLRPPSCVAGMKDLQKEKFSKTVKVPGIKLPKKQINLTRKIWKPFLLKLNKLRPIAELASDDPLKGTHCLVLFDPSKVEDEALSDHLKEKLIGLGFDFTSVEKYELKMDYENWSFSDILKAILPKDAENVSSFTQVGHIAHLNLKPETVPFKNIIGQVIIDKVPSVKSVVNKLNSIDNTYRNFEMELLAGENNYITQAKEHNCIFELDFSKVYWNSRLSTEHQRIVDAISQNCHVYDVFAGIGPFAIPLAKRKGCTVFANDLNPVSFNYLEKNIILNKIKAGHIYSHNLDGREFIRTVMKSDLLKRLGDIVDVVGHQEQNKESNSSHDTFTLESTAGDDSGCLVSDYDNKRSYVIMNLPALAVDFLDSFDSLLTDIPYHLNHPRLIDHVLPFVFCYAFCSKCENIEEEIKERAQKAIKHPLPSDATVRIVRNVSPNKEMVCLSFKLSSEIVLGSCHQRQDSLNTSLSDQAEPMTKRQKVIP